MLVTDVQDAEGQKVADEIVEKGGRAAFLHHDVADPDAWSAAVVAYLASDDASFVTGAELYVDRGFVVR